MGRRKTLIAAVLAVLALVAWLELPPLRTFVPKAKLATLVSDDFQLVISSDKSIYKLGETPRISAKIVNRSQHGAYFHNWSPTKPPGLEVFVVRPSDALPIDERSASTCAPTNPGFFRAWGGGDLYSSKFTHLLPGAVYPLDPCRQLPQGLFNSPGTYDIHIVYTNETEAFETRLDNVGKGPVNYTYKTEKQEGTWIPADADEFAAPPYEPGEYRWATSLSDKGPWIGAGWRRKRVTLREMLDHAPRMALRSKVLTIRVAEPMAFPDPMTELTAKAYVADVVFPEAKPAWMRHQRIVEKLASLDSWAYAGLEQLLKDPLSPDEKVYLFDFFMLVPGDRAVAQRAARQIIESHLANPPADQDSLHDVAKAADVLGEFGNSSDCTLLIDYLQRDDDSASWAVFNIVKKLADDEMLEKFVEVLAQKVGYAHTGSLLDESIFIWGEEVVINFEVDLLRHAIASSQDHEERHKFSEAFRALGEIRTRFASLRERYESEDPRIRIAVESSARGLLLKKTLTLDRFNKARYLIW